MKCDHCRAPFTAGFQLDRQDRAGAHLRNGWVCSDCREPATAVCEAQGDRVRAIPCTFPPEHEITFAERLAYARTQRRQRKTMVSDHLAALELETT